MGSYAVKAPQSLYSKSKNGVQSKNDVAHLLGARFVTAGETERGTAFAESQIKDITGGEAVVGEFKYKDQFSFKPICKVWFAGNHKPIIRGADDGIWRRIKLIPFKKSFKDSEKIPNLPTILEGELEGILNWAIEGCLKWQKEGLKEPKSVRDAVKSYKKDEDISSDFIEEHLIQTDNHKDRVKKADLYSIYEQWCKTAGVSKPSSKREFTMMLIERGFQDIKSKGIHHWTSLKITNSPMNFDSDEL
jgi:putative DNA primase/helicase